MRLLSGKSRRLLSQGTGALAVTLSACCAALCLTGAGQLTHAGEMRAMPEQEPTIIDEWAKVQVPEPPVLKPVKADPGTTALLVLDMQKGNCNAERRPRCVASIARVRALLGAARDAGAMVGYSLTSSAKVTDIREELPPRPGEPVVKSGVDKFFGTDLEKRLRGRGVQTVILVGTSAHGAVLNTATGAALRGFNVVVPVDGMSAGEAYAEQYTCWHLANGPGTRRHVTLTRINMIAFSEPATE